jgi:FAD/FMN-containing dehydrogenase
VTASLEDDLRAVVGDAHVLTDPAVTASYEVDWTRRFRGRSRCVVRPASTDEVAAVLRVVGEHGVPVVPQGGNTGLVGGGVPSGGELVLCTTRLTDLEPVDTVASQVTVGAGVVLTRLQEHVRRAGLDVGVDLAARDSATVGGLVATNAGGERVLRHGSMRAQVVGLEAVLADGTVLRRMTGLPKDNTGYDLPGLLAGSEGTLAVITRVRLRLVPLLRARAVALVAVDGTDVALEVLGALRARLAALEAAEVFYDDGLALVRRHAALRPPFGEPHPAYLLVEVADHDDPSEALVAALDAVAGSGRVRDAVVADDARGREDLWRYREAHTESINAEGVPVKLDVAVPVTRLAKLVEALPGTVAAACPGARVVLFGHLAEGNLHVNVLDATDRAHAVEDAVLRLAAELDGSISAEHGVGRAKVEWLALSRSAAELAAMRAVKAALDPACLLNPGVLLPR